MAAAPVVAVAVAAAVLVVVGLAVAGVAEEQLARVQSREEMMLSE